MYSQGETMNKRRKIILSLLVLIIFAWGSLFFYSHLVEHRSLTSFVIEKSLWLKGFKEKTRQSIINGTYDFKNEQVPETVDNPEKYIKESVKESTVDGMQVFNWNDKNDPQQKAILYIHGGGYYGQASNLQYKYVAKIAEVTDAKVIYPTYPLAPKYTYKDAYPKMVELYKEILASVDDPDKITLMGDSAGGGFALSLGLYFRDNSIPQPKNIIVFSPWLDLSMSNSEYLNYEAVDPILYGKHLQIAGEAWAGSKKDLNNPYVSPIFGNFRDVAPITVFVGTHEIFYPDVVKFHDQLNKAGVVHKTIVREKMNHVYPLYPIGEAKDAFDRIIDIINN